MTGLGTTSWLILTMDIVREADVVAARQRARRIAELIGFETQDQTRIATAVSEIRGMPSNTPTRAKWISMSTAQNSRRNSFWSLSRTMGPASVISMWLLEGRFNSSNGFGVGLSGARRLVEEFRVASAPGRESGDDRQGIGGGRRR